MNYEPLIFPFPGDAGGVAYLTTRSMGDMGIDGASRRAFFRTLETDGRRVEWLTQVHSREVVVSGAQPIRGAEADGIITNGEGRWIGVTVADCLPIYGRSLGGQVRFVLHSGWKGTGILKKVLEVARQRYGTRTEEISLVIGPGIGSCCYSVDRGRAESFVSSYGPGAVIEREGMPFLDLAYCNESIAREAGVRNVSTVHRCTSCDSDLGSFRRQGAESFTRMFAYH